MRLPWWVWVLLGLVVAAGVLVPLASSLPDGLESVIERQGLPIAEKAQPAPLPDYGTPGLAESRLGAFVAAAVGITVVFGVTLLLGRLLARRRDAAGPERHEPPV